MKRALPTLWKHALAVSLLAVLMTVTAGAAALAPGLETLAHSSPRAFLKDGQLRLYSDTEGRPVLFKTEWKQPRVTSGEFSYTGATLECDLSPPRLPVAGSSWREITVVSEAQFESLAEGLRAGLAAAATEPGHGVYVQHALGDVVIFRDGAGQVQIRPFAAKPEGLILDRRFNRHETASAIAGALERQLRELRPGETAFVLLSRNEGRLRLSLVDLAARSVVALFPPVDTARPGGPRLKGLRAVVSFAVVDNAWGFLKNPVSSATRTVHQCVQWAGSLLEPRLRDRGTPGSLQTNAPGMDLADWERWLDRNTGTPREQGSIRLLINGEQFYPEFERRVAEARSDLSVHVCIFDRDDVAVRMADLFKARSTNLSVRVVFDRMNTRGSGEAAPATPMAEGFVPPDSIAEYLRDGGEVRVRPLLNPGFSCDHSKVFLIDGRFAYLGGMNFGREYRYEWHDLMAEVEGPVVASLQRQFDRKWAQAGLLGDCALAAETLCGGKPQPATAQGADWIELRRLHTKTFDRQIRRAELAAIRRARNYVFLENSYLYSNDMIAALVEARRRGVDVRMVMPGENDFASGHSSNLVTANYLRRHGVRVYFYPGMSHVKALLVDGWVCFGSANFDALSLRLNRECNLATSDVHFAARFRQDVFEADFAKSVELREDVATGWGDHVSDALLNAF